MAARKAACSMCVSSKHFCCINLSCVSYKLGSTGHKSCPLFNSVCSLFLVCTVDCAPNGRPLCTCRGPPAVLWCVVCDHGCLIHSGTCRHCVAASLHCVAASLWKQASLRLLDTCLGAVLLMTGWCQLPVALVMFSLLMHATLWIKICMSAGTIWPRTASHGSGVRVCLAWPSLHSGG